MSEIRRIERYEESRKASKKFLSFLDKNDFNFVIPADLIVRLKEANLLSKEESSRILDGLKPFIKEHIYFKFKKQIGEKI